VDEFCELVHICTPTSHGEHVLGEMEYVLPLPVVGIVVKRLSPIYSGSNVWRKTSHLNSNALQPFSQAVHRSAASEADKNTDVSHRMKAIFMVEFMLRYLLGSCIV
jgi:hypothetical protein